MAWKSFVNLEESTQWRQENDTINKRAAAIVWKERNLRHLLVKVQI